MTRIAIDYTPAYEQAAGIGRLVREQVAALAYLDLQDDYRLFIAGHSQNSSLPEAAINFSYRTTSINPRWLARIWHRARVPLPVNVWVGNVDLFHATDFVLPPTLPVTRTVVTVHDLSFVRVPDAASSKLRRYLNIVVPRAVRRADHVIADSEATKRDLVDLYELSPAKISVVLSGVDRSFSLDSLVGEMTIRNYYKIPPNPYIFSIGTVQPRKNYSRIIKALSQLRAQGYDLHLVIAGGEGWLEDEMYATLAETGLQDVVHLIGFAEEKHLPALYQNAECLVFPSLYEGFGFPVLESMASGTPVITSNLSSLPEVAGDAALLVDPYNVDEITYAVQRILDDSSLRKTLIEQGYTQAQTFTWERSAQQLQGVYNHVLAL